MVGLSHQNMPNLIYIRQNSNCIILTNMENRLFIVPLLLLIHCLSINAQNTITGQVMDKENKGIPYVTISLLRHDSTLVHGTTTDSTGIYTIKNVLTDNYLLSFSSIGYDSLITSVHVQQQEQTIHPITLTEKVNEIGEITVNAQSFIRQIDRVLIIPDKQQIKHASTGYDLLYNLMIPGIDVNKTKGTVSGLTGEVALYINGEKADFREVTSLRPIDIEKVEYFDMPTGKYIGDKAVINYITKKRDTGGYVAIDGTQNIGYLKGNYNLITKIDHKNTNFTFFGGHSMTQYSDKEDKQENFYFPDHDISRNTQTNDALTKNNKQYLQLNINNTTKKRSLTGKVSFIRTDAPQNYLSKNIIYRGEENENTQSKSETNQRNLKPTINLYGNFYLSQKQTLDIYIKGSYTNNIYNRRYTEGNYYSNTNVDEDLYNLDFISNYNIQLKNQNSFGIQLAHLHQVSSSNYSGDYTEWNHLWTGETLLTAQYNQQFGSKFTLSLQGGIDFLQYRVHGERYNYFFSPYCNLMMNYQLASNQSILFTLNKGNSNPPSNWVNDVDQNIDSIQIQRGNPYLDKANYYVGFLMYSLQIGKFNMQASGYYFGAIPTVSYDYYIEGDRLINSFCSDGNYHNAKATLSVSYKTSQNLRFKASGFYQYYKMTGKYEMEQGEWGGSLDMNYFWKNFAFNIYGKSTSRTVSMYPSYTRAPATYGASISWNHKNWNVEAGTSNTFNKHNRNIEFFNADIYQFYQTRYNKLDQASGYVRIAYTIDFGRKTSRSQDKVDTSINSAILKAK